jgi:SAM-dependent methyltransferase
MSFAVSADAYDRFMGRYSIPLADVFADFAGVVPGNRVLDVGCGPGALTAELVRRVGDHLVAAVDPSTTFVEAARGRHPGVDVQCAAAERLPPADDTFDVALAQLVVHFMSDPVGGLREMARVTRPAGVVAACVWDFDEGGSPLSLFWEAARELDSNAPGEASLPGTRRGHLTTLFRDAGVSDIEETSLSISVEHDNFDDWWSPFGLGVGPAGSYLSTLDATARQRLMERCRELQPPAPFVVTAVAWAARGSVPA